MSLPSWMTKGLVLQALLTGAVLVGIVSLAFVLARDGAVLEAVSSFGYLGILGASMLSGFNFVVPVPIVAFTPVFLEAGFTIWPLIFTIAVGMTIGDTVGYLIGNTSRKLTVSGATHERVTTWVDRFRARHTPLPYLILLFYVAFVPAPNELLVIPLSFMGYRFRYMFPVIFLGNLVFNTLATFGLSGIGGLL